MIEIQQLDLPQIPEQIIESLDSVRAKQEFLPLRHHVSAELQDYLQTIFRDPITATYGILVANHGPHTDYSGREFGYNYILQQGGRHVVTSMYDNDMNVTQQVVCQPKIWYRIHTGNWHSVHGIESGQSRFLISVTYLHDIINPRAKVVYHPRL